VLTNEVRNYNQQRYRQPLFVTFFIGDLRRKKEGREGTLHKETIVLWHVTFMDKALIVFTSLVLLGFSIYICIKHAKTKSNLRNEC